MIKASKKSKIFSWKVCALEVPDLCTQTWWALPPPLVSLTLFQAAWEAVSNNSCAQAGHDWAASHKHPNQKDKIAPSVRDPEKPALDVWGGAPKIETEGQPSTLKDLNFPPSNRYKTTNCCSHWLLFKWRTTFFELHTPGKLASRPWKIVVGRPCGFLLGPGDFGVYVTLGGCTTILI